MKNACVLNGLDRSRQQRLRAEKIRKTTLGGQASARRKICKTTLPCGAEKICKTTLRRGGRSRATRTFRDGERKIRKTTLRGRPDRDGIVHEIKALCMMGAAPRREQRKT